MLMSRLRLLPSPWRLPSGRSRPRHAAAGMDAPMFPLGLCRLPRLQGPWTRRAPPPPPATAMPFTWRRWSTAALGASVRSAVARWQGAADSAVWTTAQPEQPSKRDHSKQIRRTEGFSSPSLARRVPAVQPTGPPCRPPAIAAPVAPRRPASFAALNTGAKVMVTRWQSVAITALWTKAQRTIRTFAGVAAGPAGDEVERPSEQDQPKKMNKKKTFPETAGGRSQARGEFDRNMALSVTAVKTRRDITG